MKLPDRFARLLKTEGRKWPPEACRAVKIEFVGRHMGWCVVWVKKGFISAPEVEVEHILYKFWFTEFCDTIKKFDPKERSLEEFIGYKIKDLARTHLRGRQIQMSTDVDSIPDSDPVVSDPFLREQILACLRKLSPLNRRTWVLRECHGMDYKEIAGRMGGTEGAARARVSRANEQLRKCLQPNDE